MFADIVEIEALPDLAPGKKVSICGYVRKVCTFVWVLISIFFCSEVQIYGDVNYCLLK